MASVVRRGARAALVSAMTLAPIVAHVTAITIAPAVAHAAEWQTIRPGESTQEAVRAQFGQPTKVTSQKVEGYDSPQWLYEGEQAPRGTVRMTVDFGILTPQGYKPDLVRLMHLVLKPGMFNRATVLAGWGEPQAVKADAAAPSVLYESGLIVTFEKDGWTATSMTFTPPQKLPEGPAPR